MSDQISNTPLELTQRIEAVCCWNRNTNAELRAHIAKLQQAMAAVASTPALALAHVIEKELARIDEYYADQKHAELSIHLELAKLSFWAGQIKVGWL